MATEKNNRRGRPTKYRPEYAHQAYILAREDAGLTDSTLAKLYQVNADTIYSWKKSYPDFAEALKRGKREIDKKVEKTLFQRACGYECPAEKRVTIDADGNEHVELISKFLPPDPTSMIFWLKNRDRENWRDKHDVDYAGDLKIEIVKYTQKQKGE